MLTSWLAYNSNSNFINGFNLYFICKLFLFSLIIQQHTRMRIFPMVQCIPWTAIIPI